MFSNRLLTPKYTQLLTTTKTGYTYFLLQEATNNKVIAVLFTAVAEELAL